MMCIDHIIDLSSQLLKSSCAVQARGDNEFPNGLRRFHITQYKEARVEAISEQS